MERPAELAKAQRQPVQGEVAVRARVLQPPGRLGKVGAHSVVQVLPAKLKPLAQLQQLRLARI